MQCCLAFLWKPKQVRSKLRAPNLENGFVAVLVYKQAIHKCISPYNQSHSSAALTNIFRVKLFAEGHRRADKSVCLVLIIATQLIIHRMSLLHHIYLFPFALHSLFPLVQGNQMLSHFTTTSNLSLTSFSLSYIASFMCLKIHLFTVSVHALISFIIYNLKSTTSIICAH